jgi:hypothetical protein
MRRIWKYPLGDQPGRQVVTLHSGFHVLGVHRVGNQACLYASVDPDAPETDVAILMLETEDVLPDLEPLSHLGTVVLPGDPMFGPYVLHAFRARL